MCTIFYRKSPEDGGRPGRCRQTRLNAEPEHRRSAGRGQTLPPSPFHHVFFPSLSLHLSAAPAPCIAGYTLPSADGKQITSHIKGLLSVYGHTHTCTNTHKITGPLRGRGCGGCWRGKGGWIQGVEGRGGVGEYGTAPHKGSPEIAPSHNETCHSVYEIMSN